jgi:hypothetical protein
MMVEVGLSAAFDSSQNNMLSEPECFWKKSLLNFVEYSFCPISSPLYMRLSSLSWNTLHAIHSSQNLHSTDFFSIKVVDLFGSLS